MKKKNSTSENKCVSYNKNENKCVSYNKIKINVRWGGWSRFDSLIDRK
jgi:hypothetical protein